MTRYNIGIHVDGYSYKENTEDGPVDRWEEIYTIMATSPEGRNFVLDGSDTSSDEMAKRNLAAVDTDPDSHPDIWLESSPVYGSAAWGKEDEYELACFEADAYGEPRPSWF